MFISDKSVYFCKLEDINLAYECSVNAREDIKSH